MSEPPVPAESFARAHLLQRDILPFLGLLVALALAALLVDAVLHLLDLVRIGRYLGIPGSLLILASLTYSLRKRGLIVRGNPASLLRWHERSAWLGSLLVLVHAGIHFNAVLAWLATGAMLLNVASGLTGKYLLGRARRRRAGTREQLRSDGLADAAADERLHADSVMFDLVRQWRVVHLPVALTFGVLALAHILSVLVFWGWR